MTTKKPTESKSEQLAKRTIQVIGFGFSGILTIVKLGMLIIAATTDNANLSEASGEIPWWVIFGFFGFGAAGNSDLLRAIVGGFTRGSK